MAIKEAIEIINHYLDYPKEKVREALLLSINTMRKYQKIAQIAREGKNETRCEEIVRIIDGKA